MKCRQEKKDKMTKFLGHVIFENTEENLKKAFFLFEHENPSVITKEDEEELQLLDLASDNLTGIKFDWHEKNYKKAMESLDRFIDDEFGDFEEKFKEQKEELGLKDYHLDWVSTGISEHPKKAAKRLKKQH